VIYTDLAMMAGVTTVCEDCEGKRFQASVLDEPTTGLHLAGLTQLLGLLDKLVDSGKSVIVIEHHQAVMAHADWIIDLGPGAGHDGGRIVFEGTPADLVAAKSTLTGAHLAAFVSPRLKAGESR
jgi:excinuclease UvrABC ATPase subunit